MKRLAVCDRLVAMAMVEDMLSKFSPSWGKKVLWRLEKKLGQSNGTNNNICIPHFILSMRSRVKCHKCALQTCSGSISAVSFMILIFNIVNDIPLK